jgi:hypothetical protein
MRTRSPQKGGNISFETIPTAEDPGYLIPISRGSRKKGGNSSFEQSPPTIPTPEDPGYLNPRQ